jgi:L-seryl-tRNA(Ser) seleniumtransferase
MAGDVRRKVPSVDTLLRSEPGLRASATVGRPLLKRTLLATLSEIRAGAADGTKPPSDDEILTVAIGRAAQTVFGLTPVINATGVLLHTNLGRAPLARRAATPTWRSIASAGSAGTGRAGRNCSSLLSPMRRTCSS